MKVRARLVGAAIGFLLPALALARWTASAGAAGAPAGLPVLSEPIAAWTLSSESRLTDNEISIINPDAYLLRSYEAPERAPIVVYVGLYKGRAGYDAGAHDPEVCYPAQGWEIVRSRDVEVPLANGDTLHAKLLDAQKRSDRQTVLYWFQPAARWPAGAAAEQLLRIFDAIAGRPQYAFVRLSAPARLNLEPTRDLTDFAARIAGAVRDSLDSTPSGALQPTARSERNAPSS